MIISALDGITAVLNKVASIGQPTYCIALQQVNETQNDNKGFIDDINDRIANMYNSERTIPFLEFDTITEYNYTGNSQVTSYPVEGGYNVIDFKYRQPDEISVKGIISRKGNIASLLGKSKADLISETISKLDLLKDNMKLCTITSRNAGKRKNYTLTEYNVKEELDNFGIFEVDMTFKEVIQIDDENVLASPIFKPTAKTGIAQLNDMISTGLNGE